MATGKEVPEKLEWRVNVHDGISEKAVIQEPESGRAHRLWSGLMGLIGALVSKMWSFFEKAWNLGVAEPKKVIHGIKVGLALSLVSLVYYLKPLYKTYGSNAMWAIMTVVVVLEYTVGATLSKSINRAIATLLGGSLGLCVHWVGSQSGDKLEPIVLGISTFLFGFAATFSRFIPSIKARFDYGAMIFILTFSLVSVSGYRVDELFEMAHERLSTIAIGTSLCIIISMVFYPNWAGDELHNMTHRNLEKLADSLDGYVAGYFTSNSEDDDSSKKKEEYKCVLNSKAAEDSLTNFARWEPVHGRFSYRHPWKQYPKIGATLRACAYCIETFSDSTNLEVQQVPEYLKNHLSDACLTLSSHASDVLRELAIKMKTMSKSSKIGLLTGEMKFAVQELQDALTSLPNSPPSGDKADPITKTSTTVIEVLPIAKLVYLLIETAAKVEDIADAVNELAKRADFKPVKGINHTEEHQRVKNLPEV